ncbi:MAG: hypothetical protein CSB44_05525 [Gammaproteobacteria bacterium]|nr:MAG: hypothetical protein CSB44_05525 [Gammaproteobacteria bacterium]
MRVRRDRFDENGSGENGSREPSKAGFRDAGHASETKNGSREPQIADSCEHGHTADASHDARHDDTCHDVWLSPGVSVGRETARRLCCDAHVIPLLCHYHHTLVHEGRYGIEPVEPPTDGQDQTQQEASRARRSGHAQGYGRRPHRPAGAVRGQRR